MFEHIWSIMNAYFNAWSAMGQDFVAYSRAFATDNRDIADAMAGAILMGVILILVRFPSKWYARRAQKKINVIRGNRERWMTSPEQENIEKVLISDVVCDGLNELEYLGKMSPERVAIWYRRFGNLLNLPDLLGRHEKMLKEQLRKRIKNNKIIKFPDTKPATNRFLARLANQVPGTKPTIVNRFLSRLQAKASV